MAELEPNVGVRASMVYPPSSPVFKKVSSPHLMTSLLEYKPQGGYDDPYNDPVLNASIDNSLEPYIALDPYGNVYEEIRIMTTASLHNMNGGSVSYEIAVFSDPIFEFMLGDLPALSDFRITGEMNDRLLVAQSDQSSVDMDRERNTLTLTVTTGADIPSGGQRSTTFTLALRYKWFIGLT